MVDDAETPEEEAAKTLGERPSPANQQARPAEDRNIIEASRIRIWIGPVAWYFLLIVSMLFWFYGRHPRDTFTEFAPRLSQYISAIAIFLSPILLSPILRGFIKDAIPNWAAIVDEAIEQCVAILHRRKRAWFVAIVACIPILLFIVFGLYEFLRPTEFDNRIDNVFGGFALHRGNWQNDLETLRGNAADSYERNLVSILDIAQDIRRQSPIDNVSKQHDLQVNLDDIKRATDRVIPIFVRHKIEIRNIAWLQFGSTHDSMINVLYANVYLHTDPDLAHKYLNRAIDTAKDDDQKSIADLQLAWVQRTIDKEPLDAKATISAALHGYEGKYLGALYDNLGIMESMDENYSMAEQEFHRAIDSEAIDQSSELRDLGTLYVNTENIEMARTTFQDDLIADPSSYNDEHGLALAYASRIYTP